MQKTIEQIYNGEIYPSEQMHVRMEGYEEARQIAVQSHNEFEEKLGKAMKDEKHPLPDDDFMETMRIRTQARDWAEEVVISQTIL